MKWMNRLNTVFYRLIISYIVLMIIVIGTVGGGSYLYFKSTLNEQIEQVNQATLHNIRDSLYQYVVELSEKTYIRLVIDTKEHNEIIGLFDSPYENDYNMIVQAYAKLKSERQTQPDIIDRIEVFYSKYRLGISSHSGVKYYNEPQSPEPNWVVQMERNQEQTSWIRSEDADGAETVVFVRAYPYAQPVEMVKGYVAIHIRASAIGKLIHLDSVPELGTLLLDSSFEPVISTSLAAEQLANVRKALGNADEEGYEMAETKQGAAILSFTSVPKTGWKIVSVTPVDVFYNKSIALRNTLIMICLIVVIIGVAISHVFTWNLYNPIKRLFQAAATLLGQQSQPASTKLVNEISYINYAINNLSVKVHKLESTLQHNLPLIKHHIVQSIIYESGPGGRELEQRMELLRLVWSHPKYCCVRLRIDANALSGVDVQNKHFIKYNLMDELESFRSERLLVLASELSDTDICCIFGYGLEPGEQIQSRLESIISYCRSNFMLRLEIAIGSEVDRLEKLGSSFRETKILLKYAYFRPESILSGSRFLERDTMESPLPEELIEEYDFSLREGRAGNLKAVLGRTLALCVEGPYSAEKCHVIWRRLVACLHRNMKQLGISSVDMIDYELQDKLKSIESVAQLEEWLLDVSNHFLLAQAKKAESHKFEMVDKACRHIVDNLEKAISLESVAEYVHLTPRYLSKLFKEEKGITFTEFVTQVRLNKAKSLIEMTSFSIEQISSMTGFSSSAYFIRKFKESFGSTPRVYKSRVK